MHWRAWLTIHSFCDHSRNVAMRASFRGQINEINEIGLLIFIRYTGIPKWGINSGDNSPTSCKNLDNFHSVTTYRYLRSIRL